ncbi:capsular polysaccharide synthesis protein [Wenzhouxiangella sp. EGI_FJ10305]|uniref:capsular polysaccharide synthesis protein n=1 Tax=Wenzhouxiangella sp. EGI_FJ10305 TaxID=3243768 RepID=UPI0035DE7656
MNTLPCRIFTYWHQGFDDAPELVQACRWTMKRYTPGWSHHFLDAESVQQWIEPIPIPERTWNRLSLAHRSDVIRTQLLIRHGGVWADPTVLLTQPLKDWLPERMDAGVFLFHRPGRDRAVSNWFIASEAHHPLLMRLYEELCRYWTDNEFHNFDRPMKPLASFAGRVLNRNLELPRLWLRKPFIRLLKAYPYMIYHYMLYHLVRSDPALKSLWERMPKVSADLPHFAVHRGLLEHLDDEAKRFIDSGEAPLFKLSWKLPSQDVPPESVLIYLLEQFAAGKPEQKANAS